MKKFIAFIILLFCSLNSLLFSQEVKSIHQQEYEFYKKQIKQKSFFREDGKDIIPLKNINKGLTKAIYGYLPDWLYSSGKAYLDYNLLTHISAFDFTVDLNGNIANPSYWPWTDVINDAHNKGVKIILTAVCFTQSDIHNLLTNTTAKQNFFINLKSKINTYLLDGVNIDFEGLATADRGDLLNGFMLDLTNYFRTNLPGKEVSFAGPAVNWGGWNLAGLANSCDYIFIMGYDFYGSWSSTSGPSSPLSGGNYNITNTINTQYGTVVVTNPSKLILGVPYYGNRWRTQTLDPYSTSLQHIGSVPYKDAIAESNSYGLIWSANQTVWYRYINSNQNYQVWFDNDSSLGLKYQLAQTKNLRGVGMWALGYDAGRVELWNELKKRFFVVGNVSVISPNGGEIFYSGNNYLIEWTTNNSRRVKIEYSINNGNTWSIINSSYPSDSLKYLWKVPNTGSKFCILKITDLNSNSIFDISDSTFTIIPNLPLAPNPLSPPNNTSMLSLGFSFMWSKPEGAEIYHLQVSNDSSFQDLFFSDSTITDNLKYVNNFIDGKKYYWRLAASNTAGKSNFSQFYNFSTKIIEPDSITAKIDSGKYVKLRWINNSRTSQKTIIQRKNSATGNYFNIDTIDSNLREYLDTNVVMGQDYFYRLFSINSTTYSLYSKEVFISTTNIVQNYSDEISRTFILYQNFPNPFNNSTNLIYQINISSNVKIILLNSLGQQIKCLFEGYKEKGEHRLQVSLDEFPSGIYFCKLQIYNDNKIKYLTRKLLLMK